MTAFILKRLGLALITLWILSLIVFFVGQILPGDPARSILGPLAAPSAVKALDHQLGVDKPVLQQYWDWITNFPGTSAPVSGSDRPDPDERAGALVEARGVRVHHRRAARHPRRRRSPR